MQSTPGAGSQGHQGHNASQSTGSPRDLRPYEAWLRSLHDMLPGAEGDTDRDLDIIEAEVVEQLFPTPYPGCEIGVHPRCVVEPHLYETVPPAAQLAYALTCAAWGYPSEAPEDQQAKIYEGTDGEGNCWSVGFIGNDEHRRCAFEFYTPLGQLSCRNKSELIGLWEYVARTVGETLPETEIKVRCNVDLEEPDPEDLAQTTRVLADLDHTGRKYGLTVNSLREGGYLETTVQGPEHRVIRALRELREYNGHTDGFTVDVPYGDEDEEPLYGPAERIWAVYGPKGQGGEGLISDIAADEL